MVPALGRVCAASIFSSVDLPDPLRPTSAVIPGLIAKER